MAGSRGRKVVQKAEKKAPKSKLENTDPSSGGMEKQSECANPSETNLIEKLIDDITIIESGEKEEDPTNHAEGDVAKPRIVQKKMEDRVYFVEQQLEALQMIVKKLKSKQPSKDSRMTECSRAADISYRSLYSDSQKKIEALTNGNHQLALKLEHALGKLEAYEAGACVFSKGLQKLKDVVVMMSNLPRAPESENLPSQAMRGTSTSLGKAGGVTISAPKRKRPDQQSKK
ncbi:hypothetical protein SLEP1_g1105 [Rubroshorea leprosula]|uniref:Uncharacterized protein n=1 Tax=Rubroshorea leprosula TaxID=152421 RepID=A0AAV5HCS7_9ROSI|nr:hypothetical protein SLEP1_g1105 [Rubroshorea leprosula]